MIEGEAPCTIITIDMVHILIFQIHSATLSNNVIASQLCNKSISSKVKSCEKQDGI